MSSRQEMSHATRAQLDFLALRESSTLQEQARKALEEASQKNNMPPKKRQVCQQPMGYLGRRRVVKIGHKCTPEEDRQRDKDRMQIDKGNNSNRNNSNRNRNVMYMPKPTSVVVTKSKRGCREKIPVINERSEGKRFKNRYTGEMIYSYTPEEDRRYSLERKTASRLQQQEEMDSYHRFPTTAEGCMIRMRRMMNKLKSLRKKNRKHGSSKQSRKEIGALRSSITDLYPAYNMIKISLKDAKKDARAAEKEENGSVDPYNW